MHLCPTPEPSRVYHLVQGTLLIDNLLVTKKTLGCNINFRHFKKWMPPQLTFSHIACKTPTRLIMMSIPTFYGSINPLGIVIHALTQKNVSSHFDFPIWPPLQVVFHNFSACKITFRGRHAHSPHLRTFKSGSI